MPGAICQVPRPSQVPTFTQSTRGIWVTAQHAPDLLASRMKAEPSQKREKMNPQQLHHLGAHEPARHTPDCNLGKRAWCAWPHSPRPARQSSAHQTLSHVSCSRCACSIWQLRTVRSLGPDLPLARSRSPLIRLRWEMRSNESDSFCQILDLTSFQNAKPICLVVTWFVTEVKRTAQENHTGSG